MLRQELEEREKTTLGPYAALAHQTTGRQRTEPEHAYRTAYQRDRDRILHSKAFRRLKRKTQVFLATEGDHYRTRLTHTLEAAQIARTVARALRLNEDLVEAIALGHDLGHTPFGHAGEAVLNKVYALGFNHAEQSLRVVDKLEPHHGGPGLNLTFEVRDGILNHSKGKSILQGKRGERPATMEAEIVSICDAIAYVNHDIDDAIRAGVLAPSDLPAQAIEVLGHTTSQRINQMVTALIEGSREGHTGMTPHVLEATNALRAYMYQYVYPSEALNREIIKATRLLEALYEHLLQHPIPENLAGDPNDSLERRTVDFIAGMTDQYALQLYEQLFLPKAWRP